MADPKHLGSFLQPEVSNEPSYSDAKRLMDKKKWNEAAIALRLLLKKDPKHIPVVISLSTALIQMGRREEALSMLNQTVAILKGSQRSSLIRRTRVLSKLFLTSETFKIYQEGLNQMFAKKYRNAKERFEKALAEESDNVEVLTRVGQSLILDNGAEKAVDRLLFARKLNPFEPEVHLWLGRAYHHRNAENEALPELRIALNDLPGSELAPVWLAESMFSLGQVNSAIRILNNDTKNWPFHVLSLIMSARLRSQVVHQDSQALWLARKDLQLAMSRLDQYMLPDSLRYEGGLNIDLRRPLVETKADIQKLMQQIQSRLDETTLDR